MAMSARIVGCAVRSGVSRPILVAKAFDGTPYDGHTLQAMIEQSVQTVSLEPKRI
jgi:hypothetical protein